MKADPNAKRNLVRVWNESSWRGAVQSRRAPSAFFTPLASFRMTPNAINEIHPSRKGRD